MLLELTTIGELISGRTKTVLKTNGSIESELIANDCQRRSATRFSAELPGTNFDSKSIKPQDSNEDIVY